MDERGTDEGASGLATCLEAARARGAARYDPIEMWTIEALVRRAGLHGGTARAVVEAKARRRLGELVARLEQASALALALASASDGSAAQPVDTAARSGDATARSGAATRTSGDATTSGRATTMSGGATTVPRRSALADLVAHIAEQPPLLDAQRALGRQVASTGPELKALRYFQSTWATLGVERRLRQSLSALPENAGPLNSQRLVHRALTAMRELSPAYLEHFVEQVDSLLWLDEATGGTPMEVGSSPRGEPASLRAEVVHGGSTKADKPARKRASRKSP